jgi:tetratricopeptide (TPR) repeat protein
MKHIVVAVALLAACRGGKAPSRKDAGPQGSASVVSVVPKLPRTEDGVKELAMIDRRIANAADDLRSSIPLRLQRASIRGRLEDYQQALVDSGALVTQAPGEEVAWRLRVEAAMHVHQFATAREAMKELAKHIDPSFLVEYEIGLADATGDVEKAIAGREQQAKDMPSATTLTLLAATLAQAGRTDEAIAMIPKAAAAVRDNPPHLIAWLLFQWGRCYELKGELAAAREFFAASHARLPGYLEATTHLADTMMKTGDTAGAKKLVDDALAADKSAGVTSHPALLELAASLGHPELLATARSEWERYVAALPLAFCDHAARFYLGVGKNPSRALELARMNLANRDTRDARALVVEAALAAGDTAAACAAVDPLVSAGTRAQRFMAWRALSQCGRTGDADRLGRELGIGVPGSAGSGAH